MITLDRKTKIYYLILDFFFTGAFVLWVLVDYNTYHNLPDAPKNDVSTTIMSFVFYGMLILSFSLLYIINLIKLKKIKLLIIMNIIIGSTPFFLICSIINLIAPMEELSFDTSFLSIFISSSFTLLGFGLTIVCILIPKIIPIIKKDIDAKKSTNDFADIIVVYILFFIFGLLFTVSALFNTNYIGTIYYKVRLSRAIIYSSAQMIMIIIELISYYTKLLLEKGYKD